MRIIIPITAVLFTFLSSSFTFQNEKATFSITINVNELRNSTGIVQFTLYNKDGSIPDEEYKNYYKMQKSEIVNGKSTYTFRNIPPGKYAANILHDENKNGKIDKGFILPIEGIGFSNFKSIGLTNRPNFSKASFELTENKTINVKVIYM